HERTKDLIYHFHQIEILHIARSENEKANVLAKVAASLTLPDERDIKITIGERNLITPGLERPKPGSLSPSSSRGHQYILAATDYFSKWTEAIPLKGVGSKDVVNFIRVHLIYRYGVHSKISLDNAIYFKNQHTMKLVEKFGFKHSFSSSYNPSSNG
ncbi:hypothetical protein V2J09_000454, partial [Rumex salicifolius]